MSTCAYRVDGNSSAPTVVLLHSIATHSEMWAPQVAIWSSVYRVVRIDLPGHGDSPEPVGEMTMESYADAVNQVLNELAAPEVSLVGLSLGGMIAQAFALKYPDKVRSLVLAHSGAKTDPAVARVWDARVEQTREEGFESQILPTLERWFTRDFYIGSPLTIAWLEGIVRRTSTEGYVSAVRAIQALNHLEMLSRLSQPVLVIAGEEDSAIPPAKAALIAKHLVNADLFTLKKAAHMGNIEQPVAFTEAVGTFLNKVYASVGCDYA